MHATGTIVVDRPRTAVFEYMDVPENQARISPRLSAVETLGTLDNGGKYASYTYQLLGRSFEGEVHGVEHDPPAAVTFEMTGDIGGHIHWEFEPTDRGTRVTYTATYDLGLSRPVAWLLGPLTSRLNRREIDATLGNLRAAVETSAPS